MAAPVEPVSKSASGLTPALGPALTLGFLGLLALSRRGARNEGVPLAVVVGLLRREDGTGDPDWVEGLVAQASVYPRWSLVQLPTRQIYLDCTDEETAREYSVGIEHAPPIVALPGRNGKYDVLDGGHRALAADMVNKPVWAYVPEAQGSRAWTGDPFGVLEVDGWRFDPEDGLGAVPLNASVDYHGFVVPMTAQAFLSLVPTRPRAPREDMVRAMRQEGVGPPFLDVRWEGGNLRVLSHEGRGRAMSLLRAGFQGEMPVHVFFRDGSRARHLEPEALAAASFLSDREAEPFSLPLRRFYLQGDLYAFS